MDFNEMEIVFHLVLNCVSSCDLFIVKSGLPPPSSLGRGGGVKNFREEFCWGVQKFLFWWRGLYGWGVILLWGHVIF